MATKFRPSFSARPGNHNKKAKMTVPLNPKPGSEFRVQGKNIPDSHILRTRVLLLVFRAQP